MGIITLSIAAADNQPPSSTGWVSVDLAYNELYVFTLADFTTNTNPPYEDPEGDALENVKISTLPTIGSLTLSAVAVSPGDDVSSADIVAGNLKYQADVADTDGYDDSDMTFRVSDVGSSSFTSVPEKFTFSVAAESNQPPSQVGDGSMSIGYGETGVFTTAMFTSDLIPEYVDPEGDPAFNLLVTGLPTLGNIQLSGVNIFVDQVVSFEDINDGLLTYVPDLTDIDGDMQGFTFQVSDSGSLIYAG